MKTRLSKLIDAIEEYQNNYVYYDEDLEDEVIIGTEEDMYQTIMQDDELHLLGKECVHKWVHTWYTEWNVYEALVRTMRKNHMI